MLNVNDKVLVIDSNMEAVVLGYSSVFKELVLIDPINKSLIKDNHTWSAFEDELVLL